MRKRLPYLELITALPGNQVTVTLQKTSVAKQEYTQFDTLPPRPPPEITHPICILFISFISELLLTLLLYLFLNADFTDVHEISLMKTLYIV
jgi:hypothetical protein